MSLFTASSRMLVLVGMVRHKMIVAWGMMTRCLEMVRMMCWLVTVIRVIVVGCWSGTLMWSKWMMQKRWKMLWVMVPGMMIVIWRLVIYMKMRIVKMTWCMVQLPPH